MLCLPLLKEQRRNPLNWVGHLLDNTKYVGLEGLYVLAHLFKPVSTHQTYKKLANYYISTNLLIATRKNRMCAETRHLSAHILFYCSHLNSSNIYTGFNDSSLHI